MGEKQGTHITWEADYDDDYNGEKTLVMIGSVITTTLLLLAAQPMII